MNSTDTLQQTLLETYQKNMELIALLDEELFKKINLLDEAINNNLYKAKYELEYINNNFDLYIHETNSYLYNKKSDESTLAKTNDVTIDNLQNNFNPYKHYKFSEREMQEVNDEKKYPPLDSIFPTTANIMHYVDQYAPIRSELKKIYKFIFIGTGLGLHINSIDEKIKASSYLIIEPDLEVFRLSLFVTKYFDLVSTADLTLLVAYDDKEFKYKLNKFSSQGVGRNNNWKFDILSSNHKPIAKKIQDFIVAQDHLAYPFYVHYQDAMTSYKYWTTNHKFLSFIEKNYNFNLKSKPFLIIGSGPSLQKNIDTLQKNQSKFIIVAAYSSLTTLYNHNITPDIVVHIDASSLNKQTIEELESDFIKNTIFLFGSIVPQDITNLIPKENTYLFQMRYAINSSLGNLVGDSVGDLIYTMLLLLDIENIYLLGLDLALDPETNKVHSDGHVMNLNPLDVVDEVQEGMNTSNHKMNTIKVKGNFEPYVYTIGPFYTAISNMNKITNSFKEVSNNIYNLNNGAYFEYTTPMDKDSFLKAIQNYEVLDKSILFKNIHNEFNHISTNKLEKKDLELIYKKLLHAQELQVIVAKFKSFPVPETFEEYRGIISKLTEYLIKEGPVEANELTIVIANYFKFILHFIYEFFNKKVIKEEKEHLDNIHKMFSEALEKIVNTYVINMEKYSKQLNKKA